MQLTIEYTCDYCNGDDQSGRIIVGTPSGRISATWSCEGGMGEGAEVVENTSSLTDSEADDLVNCSDICQGIGKYTAILTKDEHGWCRLTDVVWR